MIKLNQKNVLTCLIDGLAHEMDETKEQTASYKKELDDFVEKNRAELEAALLIPILRQPLPE